ncbi:MAG: ribosome silencing factor [Phycisphaerales bacterium]|nr:ribosome silencing factor [Phycisphaerales bacterium]
MSSLNPATPVNIPTAATTFDVKAVAIEIARLLSDDKCSEITLLDVRGISSVQDFVILASGTSDRQMRSAATDVKNMLPKLGSSVYRTSIDDQSTWIVVDCVDTVIHIFEPNTRSYYDLESMWGDAPKVEWLREGQKPYSPDEYTNDAGDSDEPAEGYAPASSEPDADIEMTTGTAAAFAEGVRASVAKPARKAKKPAKAPAPAAKKTKPKHTASKPAAKAKPLAKKAAAKKPPAKKAAAKPAKKQPAKPVKKAAKPVKKATKKPAAKAVKKAAKKKGR